MSVKEKMTSIADAIREKTGTAEPLTLDDIANGVNEVYEAGKEKEWSDFWDIYQFGGQRVNYNYAFATEDNNSSIAWTDETFKPKYSIRPTTAQRAFYRIAVQDVAKVFKERGIEFDTSNCTDTSYLFAKTTAEHLPTLDLSLTKTITGIVFYSDVQKIDKIIWGENITAATNPFVGCYKLAEFVSEGTLGISISFASCPLTPESMKSIIKHLKNYAGTDKEYTYTVTFKEDIFLNLENSGFTREDIEWMDENGIEYPTREETEWMENEDGSYFIIDFSWSVVIDDLKWNLVTVW